LSLMLILLGGLVAGLLSLLVWALCGSGKPAKLEEIPGSFEESGRVHVDYLPLIRQALAPADLEFLASRAPGHLVRRVRRERRRIALSYLTFLRGDFEKQLQLARVIALLSTEVVAVQEFERVRLTVNFMWHYRLVWLRVWAGFAPLPQMNDLSNLLSGLNVRLEEAMKELGERAAIVAEMVSSPDRRRIHPV
jgi:hypothetical protein